MLLAPPAHVVMLRRAWAILITPPSPQAVAPRVLERRLRASGLREGRHYRCDARGCFGTFFGAHDTRRVIYGINRERPYLGVQIWPNP